MEFIAYDKSTNTEIMHLHNVEIHDFFTHQLHFMYVIVVNDVVMEIHGNSNNTDITIRKE